MPIISCFQEQIDKKLLNDSKVYYSDIDETALMKGNKSSQASYITTLVSNGIITVNEARAMIDLNKMDDGQCDKLLIPYTDINQNTITDKNIDENNNEQS